MAQNYVLVQRALTGEKTLLNPDGSMVVQNVGEFLSYLNATYLSQGYEIHTINPVPLAGDVPVGTIQYAYHLVKSVK